MGAHQYQQKPQPMTQDERERHRKNTLRAVEEGKAALRRMIIRGAIKMPPGEANRLGIK